MSSNIPNKDNSMPKRLLPLLVDNLRQTLVPSPYPPSISTDSNNLRLELINLLGAVPAPHPPPLTKANLKSMLGPLFDQARQVGDKVPICWPTLEKDIYQMEVKLEELCRSPPHPMAPDSPALQQQLTVLSAVLSFIHETCLHIDNLQSFQDERRMELEMQIRETMTNSPFRRLAEELQSDVDNHVRTITRLQSELSSCNKTIASLQSELNSRNDTIASLKTDVEKHLKTIASLKTDVDKHLTKITNLESESTQLHKTLSLSQKQLVTTTADNDSLRKNLQEATTSVNSLSKEVEGLKRIIQQSNEQMEAEKKRAVQKNKSIMELQVRTKERLSKRILEMTSLPDYAREAIKVLYPNKNDRLIEQADPVRSIRLYSVLDLGGHSQAEGRPIRSEGRYFDCSHLTIAAR